MIYIIFGTSSVIHRPLFAPGNGGEQDPERPVNLYWFSWENQIFWRNVVKKCQD